MFLLSLPFGQMSPLAFFRWFYKKKHHKNYQDKNKKSAINKKLILRSRSLISKWFQLKTNIKYLDAGKILVVSWVFLQPRYHAPPQRGAKSKACWTCGWVGHFSANCASRKCWRCGRPEHEKRCTPGKKERERHNPTATSHGWEWSGRKKEESTGGFSVDRKGGSPVRALVGTGASVFLIRTVAYDNLRIGVRLKKPDLMLTQASGKKLHTMEMVWLPLRVGGFRRKHKLYVASKLCHQVILGEDWLSGWKAELKFDPPPHSRSEEQKSR